MKPRPSGRWRTGSGGSGLRVEHQRRSTRRTTWAHPRCCRSGQRGEQHRSGSPAAADLADLRAVLGPDARLTVPTLNAANLRRYLDETPTLRIAPIPSVFPGAVRRLVREHDLVVLVEGSAYMDTWTPALLRSPSG